MNMKKIAIALLVLMLSLVALVGCFSDDSDSDAETQANQNLDEMLSAAVTGDETTIMENMSSDGITVKADIEGGGEETFSEEDIQEIREELAVFYESLEEEDSISLTLENKVTESENGTVVIKGTLDFEEDLQSMSQSTNGQLYSSLITSMSENKKLTIGSFSDLQPQGTEEVDHFSLEFPEGWETDSSSSEYYENIVGTDGNVIVEGKYSSNRFDDDDDPETYVDGLKSSFENIDEVPLLSSADVNLDSDPVEYSSNISGESYNLDATYEYHLLALEVKFEQEGDDYLLTELTFGEASETDEYSFGAEGYVYEDEEDNGYIVEYFGLPEAYDEQEAQDILDSLVIN
ncbi:MAG: hypothetical protein ACOCZM_02680 [Bacillota bacterium]